MAYKPVRRNSKIRDEILADTETRALYEATKLQIDLSMRLKKARLKSKLSQEDVAEMMKTKKPAISRLETSSEDIKNFPSLLTLVKYASAVGYELKFGLTPIKHK